MAGALHGRFEATIKIILVQDHLYSQINLYVFSIKDRPSNVVEDMQAAPRSVRHWHAGPWLSAPFDDRTLRAIPAEGSGAAILTRF